MERILKRFTLTKVLIWIVLLHITLVTLLPLLWMFSGSLKTLDEILSYEINIIPKMITFENYLTVIHETNIPKYFFNSTIIVIFVVLSNLFFCSFSGYGLAKFDFPGRDIITLFILSTMIIPAQVIMIPMYIVIRKFGLINTYSGLFLPYAVSAIGIFLMRQSIIRIPDALLDVARLDGCSEFRIYTQIILPLSKASLSILAIITFLYNWNDLLWPLIIIQSEGLKTLPLGLADLVLGEYGASYNNMMSATVLATIPVLVLFLFFQRNFVKGIVMTGLKG